LTARENVLAAAKKAEPARESLSAEEKEALEKLKAEIERQ
jgi:hypothetical protein